MNLTGGLDIFDDYVGLIIIYLIYCIGISLISGARKRQETKSGLSNCFQATASIINYYLIVVAAAEAVVSALNTIM